MTEPGQTDNYTLSDHISAIHSHVGRGIIDYCLSDTSDLIPEYVRKYNQEGADVVELDGSNVTSQGIKLIKRDLATSKNGVIRHNADKVAKIIMDLICNELRFKDLQNDTEYMLIESVLKEQKKYLTKLAKTENKNRKSNKKQTMSKNTKKIKSKFATKYKDRVESIQNSDTQTVENRRIAEEIEKMEAKLKKKTNTKLKSKSEIAKSHKNKSNSKATTDKK